MLTLKNISPSRIKTFDTCKFKYWLTYVAKPKPKMKSNWGAAHGSLIHDVLENYVNGEDPDHMGRLYRGYGGVLDTLDRYGEPEIMETPLVWAKPEEFAEKWRSCDTCPFADQKTNQCSISLEKLDELTGCPKTLFEGSVTMLEKVMARYEETWNKLIAGGTEYQFKIPLAGCPEVPILGIMDLVVEEDEDTIHIMDYKAGKHTQNFDEIRADIQARMYSLAARKEFIEDISGKGYRYKNVILTFDYFRNKPITVAFTAEEDAKTEDFVLRKIEEIRSTKWINRIVRNDAELDTKTRFGQVAFTCKYLCDSAVCKSKWEGPFNTDGKN